MITILYSEATVGDGRRSRPAGRIPLRFICPNNPFLPPPPPPRSLHAYNKMLRGPSFLHLSLYSVPPRYDNSIWYTIIYSVQLPPQHIYLYQYTSGQSSYAFRCFFNFFPDIFLDRLDRHIGTITYITIHTEHNITIHGNDTDNNFCRRFFVSLFFYFSVFYRTLFIPEVIKLY